MKVVTSKELKESFFIDDEKMSIDFDLLVGELSSDCIDRIILNDMEEVAITSSCPYSQQYDHYSDFRNQFEERFNTALHIQAEDAWYVESY